MNGELLTRCHSSCESAAWRRDRSLRRYVLFAVLVTSGLLIPAATRAKPGAGDAPRPVRRHLSRSTTSRWQPAGFGGGGAFLGIHFDTAHPGVVYACSDVSGVFRSTDYGEHWEMRSVGLGNLEVSSFALDPFGPNTLYAGAGALAESNRAGMYVSRDAGLDWQLLGSTTANRITFRRMRTLDAIAPDPSRRGVILAGTRGNGIWRTTDAGASWSLVLPAPSTSAPFFDHPEDDDPTGTPHPAPVATVAFDPASPATVYAAIDGAGVYKSIAGGIAGSWLQASSGLPAQPTVRDLAISSGGTLYVAMAASGVFRTVNGGASWAAVNGNLPLTGVTVSSVAAHPTSPSVAYAALVTYDYSNIWKTTDGGVTWAPEGTVTFDEVHNPTRAWNQGQSYPWEVRLDPFNPNRLYYAHNWGIMRSDDGAVTAADKIVGAQDTCVSSLTVDSDHPAGQPDTLYATQWDDGVVASTDKGATWTAVQPRTWEAEIVGHYWDFAIIRVGGTKVYLTTSTTGEPETCRVQRSTDAETWTTVLVLPRPPSGFVGAVSLAVDPTHPTTIYAAVDGASVYKSTDGAVTWAATRGQPGDNSFTYALKVDDHGRVFAGTLHGGLWRSTDGGDTWTHVLDELSAVYRVAVAPGAVYATGIGDDVNLYRSADGGTTWQRVTDFLPSDDGDGVGIHGMGVAVDPANPNHLFFSMVDLWHNADAGAGIAESTDGGTTWAWGNSGLGLLSVGVLTVGPDGTVYAGTSCGGIWARK